MKTKTSNEKGFKGFTNPLIAGYPSLKLHKYSPGRLLLIDSDNVFWAVLKDDLSLEQELKEKVLPLYNTQKNKLDEEIRSFRFDINLSAVYINATDRCNGRCQYCYIPEKMRTEGMNISQEILYSALNEVLTYFQRQSQNEGRKPVVIFHGSEPLLVKRLIFDAINDYKDKILFGIQTNATMMEEEDARFMIDNKVSVGISLDSLDSLRNDKLRPMIGMKSAFDAVMNALQWFQGYKGLNVVTTITNMNVHELPEIVRFLHRNKVKAALINPIRCTLPGTTRLQPGQEELYKYFKEAVDTAIDLTISSGEKIVISSFSNTLLAIIAPVARRLMCDITPCGGARRFFYIMADGSTTPCGEFISNSNFRAGSVMDHSIESIFDSKPFQKVRSRTAEVIEECRQCIYKNICGAPCPAEIQEIEGSMFSPSPYCDFYKKIIDYAFYLISENKVNYLLRDEMTLNLETVYNLM